MDLTPKKIVESRSRCFICTSASLKNNKIFIFGKSSLDIAEVIRSSLSVDVSRYSENSELFVCRDKCYQRLIKFNRASVKLKELKKEIEEVFKARENLRAKRLLRTGPIEPFDHPRINLGLSLFPTILKLMVIDPIQFTHRSFGTLCLCMSDQLIVLILLNLNLKRTCLNQHIIFS